MTVMIATCLIGLAFGGVFKAFFELISFDAYSPTLLSASLLFLFAFVAPKPRLSRDGLWVIIALILFTLSYTFSFLYSPSSEYGPTKLIGVLGLIFCFTVGLMLPLKAGTAFLKIIPVFGVFVSIIFAGIMSSDLVALALFDFSGVGLIAGEIVGLGAIILIYGSERPIVKLWGVSLCVFLMLYLGARGPALFFIAIGSLIAIAAVPVSLRNVRHFSYPALRSLVLTVVGVIIVASNIDWQIILDATESGLSRFLMLFESDKGQSVSARVKMISDAIYHIERSPVFGHGLGSYGLIVYGEDFRAYPHNGFLEIWFESGVFGLLLFITFIASAVTVGVKNCCYALSFAIIYLTLNFLKSSSLEELRILFLLCGMTCSYSFHNGGARHKRAYSSVN